MKAKTLLITISLIGAAIFAPVSAHAVPVLWSFTSPAGDVGSTTHDYLSTPLSQILTATAFGTGGNLFGKTGGGDEDGLGLALGPDQEISGTNFIQLDITKVNFIPNSLISFQAGSTTNGEGWQVIGSNTAGSNSGTLLGSCTSTLGSGPGNSCENVMNLLSSATSFHFLDVSATGPAGSNILIAHLDAQAVPGPIVGAGVPGVILAGGALLALAARRRRQLVA
jgi:hypothetical protein